MNTTQKQDETMNSSNIENFVLSADPRKAMQEMMENIDTLRTIYVRETEALMEADTAGFLSLQDEKLEAARDYQSGVQQMLARKEEMRSVDPTLKGRLQAMQKDFSTLAEKNAEALGRMNRSVERLGNTIRNAAKDAAADHRSFSYGQNGKMQRPETKTVSTGLSETA